MILPRFGGSPAVWTSSVLFFQAMLLAGYGYAHLSMRYLVGRLQPIVHLVVMASALVAMPIAVPAAVGALGSGDPIASVLTALALAVGLPFFALSGNAPIFQAWYARTGEKDAADPYFLYRASNMGSLLALLGYPLLLEPSLGLTEQSSWWRWGYFGLLAVTALLALRVPPRSSQVKSDAHLTDAPITTSTRLSWLALSAVPSSLMLGITTYWTTNITPMPLLWVIPLAIYLWTYIAAFAAKPLLPVKVLARALPLLTIPLALALVLESDKPISVLAPLHILAFTAAALMCHTRLAESRPAASHLTEFYFWLALGGVVGGGFNALLAPHIFPVVAEYPIAVVAACLLRPRVTGQKLVRADWMAPVALGLFSAGLVTLAAHFDLAFGTARTLYCIGFPLALSFLTVDRPIRFGLSVGAVFLASFITKPASTGTTLHMERSFFGVHRILESTSKSFHSLVHGNTLHGMQFLGDRSNQPLTYYHRTGPLGDVFEAIQAAKPAIRVAAVGLGTGSVAAYSRPNDHFTFFEIDPSVLRVASNPNYFTFLRDALGQVDTVLGDARLTLASQPDGEFDLIVLDAFSSDAIPIHLITREAVAIYLRKLKPNGVVAFHLSNRYLALKPVVATVCNSLHLVCLHRDDTQVEDERSDGKSPSNWEVAARSPEHFGRLQRDPSWDPVLPHPRSSPWTDDYSNIAGSFKFLNEED